MTTSFSQNAVSGGELSVFFASKARVAVLRVFLIDPRRDYYQRQLTAVTGQAIRAIQRELDRLTASGLLYRRPEGNRAYYRIDERYPLFPELRAMILKAASPIDRFRAALATDDLVHMAFLNITAGKALVVRSKKKGTPLAAPPGVQLTLMKAEEFEENIQEDPESFKVFIEEGVDLLGRRGDILWQRIESAGFQVTKGEGVA